MRCPKKFLCVYERKIYEFEKIFFFFGNISCAQENYGLYLSCEYETKKKGGAKMELKKAALRLNKIELKKAALDKQLETNEQIAEAIGVSVSQLWRATLPSNHASYNAPGQSFIAGVLKAFGEPFERFFFLEE